MNTEIDNSFYGDGKFEFIESEDSRELFICSYKAISECELWSWLSNFEPDGGFMSCSHENIERINDVMMKDPVSGNHSGSSYAIVMRTMQAIAKYGYECVKKEIIANDKDRKERIGKKEKNVVMYNNYM